LNSIDELKNKIFNEDCISNNPNEGMNRIPDKSINMILCDLPYQKTRNKWDIVIPFEKLWKQYERIIKNNGAIVLTSNEPFTTDLINSNRKLFKYKCIWIKSIASGQMNCNYVPLKIYEEILIFSKASACYVKNKNKAMIYNPQFTEGKPYKIKRNIKSSDTYDYQKANEAINTGFRYPTDVINISNPRIKNGHPTQKPIELFKYLIKTYTNEGDVVLDNCCGSGTTGIACIDTNREYILMDNGKCDKKGENYGKYWADITQDRIDTYLKNK